jgi:hypothetical protein
MSIQNMSIPNMSTLNSVTRRRFVQLAAAAGAATLAGPVSFAQSGPMTARQIVDIIKAKIGVPWDEKGYRDTFKLGDPDTPVTGVASTFMSTLDVIQKAKILGGHPKPAINRHLKTGN